MVREGVGSEGKVRATPTKMEFLALLPRLATSERGALRCDFRHVRATHGGAKIERLISRTALGCHLRFRRSVQRFERDTYHGDALPTELRGRVLSCLTCGFTPPGGHSGRAQRSYSVDLTLCLRPSYPPRALESLPHSCRRCVSTWRRRTSPCARSAHTDDRAPAGLVPDCQGYAHSRAQHQPCSMTTSSCC